METGFALNASPVLFLQELSLFVLHYTVFARKTGGRARWGNNLLQKQFVYLLILLQLENTNQENINKLLEFAQQNHLKLSLIDDESENNYLLPGKPLTPAQLTQLIENSRNSGMIAMDEAHRLIRNSYDSG